MSTGSGPAGDDNDRLSAFWSLFYISAALVITFLYYRNLGLWRLFEHARRWLEWVRVMLGV
ncbi:hypothetical protein [Neomoorella thermoacetica]|uniref:Uncharacterized protein n=1 Tax=Neomoorella thermoacetica TaxID=1525 RepID=A0A1D7XD76_NEOTH|nr:hypothetical protein [Moorella thermoacetica]AKX94750.1 hypothetical protein MOTHE_c19670 [Moorella thermoacetica]AKX97382.1 hypothetical protein MOTHA_c20460 [Moorella thermoacetica]AOQ24886.1 hypothetical protein Maut_02466 [Moorella thermoacetica]APC09147.1 hypothetical protein MTJW_19980 [Moorella thermoacetica]OIQ08159.1 hypothetical protein MOOR_22340 [Moorella thermoacetica]